MNTISHVRISIVLGITLMAALLYLVLFLSFSRRIQYMWFSLVCLMVALRTLGIDYRLIATLFPNLDWHIDYLIGYLATSGFIVFIILYIDTMFQNPGLLRIVKYSAVLTLAAHAVFIVLTPVLLYSKLQIPYNIALMFFSVSVMLNVAWLIIKNKDKRHPEHFLVMLGAVSNVVLGMAEVVIRNANPQITLNYTQAGALIFMFAGTVALSLYFKRTETELAVAKEHEHRLAEETAFYRKMSHSMRTPLTIISTNIQTARRRPEEAGALLEHSQAEIMKMAGMISDALADSEEAPPPDESRAGQ